MQSFSGSLECSFLAVTAGFPNLSHALRRDDKQGDNENGADDREQDEHSGDGDGGGANDGEQADKRGEDEPEHDRSAREGIPQAEHPGHKLIALAVVGILILANVAGVLWWLEARKWKKTDNAYIRIPMARLTLVHSHGSRASWSGRVWLPTPASRPAPCVSGPADRFRRPSRLQHAPALPSTSSACRDRASERRSSPGR